MKLSENIFLLEELGITDYLRSCGDDEAFSFIINALADYFFPEEDIFTFLPSDPTDTDKLYFHFSESGYPVDWYELVSGSFRREMESMDIAKDDAIYFSRQPLPYQRGVDKKDWLKHHDYFKHIGIYAFKVDEFYEILELEESPLEKAEKLEQLRWIANHFTIQTLETDEDSRGIDTPEDLLRVVR